MAQGGRVYRGYRAGGEDTLALLKKQGFDILLLDIQLDDISGMDVPSHVKENYSDSELFGHRKATFIDAKEPKEAVWRCPA